MKHRRLWVAVFVFLLIPQIGRSAFLESYQQGNVSLSSSADYNWWYGCSPTSAGMMMGYYDQTGYGNLIPGDQVESDTFGSGPYRVNDIIASPGHIDDFYRSGYLSSGDDLMIAPTHEFNCLADFMGTSQDIFDNPNGSTTFWNYSDGSRLYDWEIYGYGPSYYQDSGMFGIREFVDYSGYEVANLFNQYIDGFRGNTLGFTFEDYVTEIDAGRPVMIHVEGHSMYGYGYDLTTTEILLHDTWSLGEKRMIWGGAYNGMVHLGVTAMELTIPEPTTLLLLGVGWLLTRQRS